MNRLTSVFQDGVARFALASVVAFGVSTSALAQSPVSVTMTLTLDNEYAIFATDPNTNTLTLIGSDTNWFTHETYIFSAPFGSYLYVVGRNIGSVSMFVSKTVFNNSTTVLTGVPNPFANWEVNTRYRPNDFNIIPIAGTQFTKTSEIEDHLLKVPPARRGNRAGARLGSPRKAGGT